MHEASTRDTQPDALVGSRGFTLGPILESTVARWDATAQTKRARAELEQLRVQNEIATEFQRGQSIGLKGEAERADYVAQIALKAVLVHQARAQAEEASDERLEAALSRCMVQLEYHARVAKISRLEDMLEFARRFIAKRVSRARAEGDHALADALVLIGPEILKAIKDAAGGEAGR